MLPSIFLISVALNIPQILFEDNHLIAVNKPSGVLVQPDKSNGDSLEVSVKQYIKDKYDKPGEVFLGVCHRIDRPVSGVVVLARTSKALVRLNEKLHSNYDRIPLGGSLPLIKPPYGTITAIDRDAGTVTFSGTITSLAATDYIAVSGQTAVASGLAAWAPSSAPSSPSSSPVKAPINAAARDPYFSFCCIIAFLALFTIDTSRSSSNQSNGKAGGNLWAAGCSMVTSDKACATQGKTQPCAFSSALTPGHSRV